MPSGNILIIAEYGKIMEEGRRIYGDRGGPLTKVHAEDPSQVVWYEVTGIPLPIPAYSVTNRPYHSGMTPQQGRGHDHGTGI